MWLVYLWALDFYDKALINPSKFKRIKVLNDEVTLGTTVDGGCHHAPFFAEFGSDRGNREVLSFDNPLNKFVMDLLLEMIVLDE